MPKELPSIDLLHKLLKCDPITGKLHWKARPVSMFSDSAWTASHKCNNWNANYANREAFTALTNYYKSGRINNKLYLAHRVIWAMHHGSWPIADIDHIDGNRINNAISNLRNVSRAENLRNVSRRSDNKSGTTGVHWRSNIGKWSAEICKDGAKENLGYFDALEDAVSARKAAEVRLGFHPNHGRYVRK